MKVSVKIVNKSHHALPSYSTLFSAGMDIRANLSEPVTLAPLERKLIPTGLYIALPEGYEAQVRPRSGDGERICQMVVKEYCRVEWDEVESLDETERGAGGFGHTGVK